MIGQMISHFRVVDHLGSGSMGSVYLAEDTKLRRRVALKVLEANIAHPDYMLRFEREARMVGSLNHPNIVTLHSIEREGDLRMLCMEYVDGKTLNLMIPQGGMPLYQFFDIAIPLCDALGAAHTQGMTHRDLKPGNIMITPGGRVKVLDFGLAKLIEDTGSGDQLTEEGGILGSLPYMAPEQLRGEPATQRFDVFSLGSLFYEMLTGRRAFTAERIPAVMRSLLDDMPPAIELIRPDVPLALAEIVDRCHAKDPDLRFRDAVELRAALKELQQELILTTTGEFRVWDRPAVARSLSFAGTTLILVLAAFSLSTLLEKPPPPETPVRSTMAASPLRIAVLPFEVRGSEELSYLQHGLVDLLSAQLDEAGALRSIDPRAVLRSVPDPPALDDAQQAAGELQADRYVLGSLIVGGQRLQLTASLYSVDGADRLARASASGPRDQIFELVDDLTSQILAGGDHGPGQQLNRSAALTTSSLPALKSYLRGEQAFRGGEFQAAYDRFRAAVEEDPDFALAWYRLSVAAEWLGDDAEQRIAAERASTLADRLPELYRRLVEAFAASREGKIIEARRAYHALIAEYPENLETWFQLAEIQFHFGPLYGDSVAAARDSWERILAWEPDHVPALLHLARIAALERRDDDLRILADRFFARSHGERQKEMKALIASIDEDRNGLEEIVDSLSAADDSTVFIAGRALAIYADDEAGAMRILDEMVATTRRPETRATGYVLRAELAHAQGDLDAAAEELLRAGRIDPDLALVREAYLATLPFIETTASRLELLRERLSSWDAAAAEDQPPRMAYGVHNGTHDLLRIYLLGLVEIRLGVPHANDRIGELADLAVAADGAGDRRRLATDLASGLRAQLALLDEGEAAALAILGDQPRRSWLERHVAASPFLSRARERYLRAWCLEQTGRLEDAADWYGSFEAHSIHGLVFRASALRRRAEVYEALGESAAARGDRRRAEILWTAETPIPTEIVGL